MDELDDADALAAICLAPENFEEASEILLALKSTNRPLAGRVALGILTSRIGDIYYRAHAFDILYTVSQDAAIEYIELNASAESVYVLGTMLEDLMEDACVSDGQIRIMQTISLLRKALNDRLGEEPDSP